MGKSLKDIIHDELGIDTIRSEFTYKKQEITNQIDYMQNKLKDDVYKEVETFVEDLREEVVSNAIAGIKDYGMDLIGTWVDIDKVKNIMDFKTVEGAITKFTSSLSPQSMAGQVEKAIKQTASDALSKLIPDSMIPPIVSDFIPSLSGNKIFATSKKEAEQVSKPDLGTYAPPSSSALDTEDVNAVIYSASTDEKTYEHVLYSIAESFGLVMDRGLSIGYAKNYLFTKKPVLESDTSGGYKSYVFFTRPNLNLLETENGFLTLRPELGSNENLLAHVHTNPSLFSELCRVGCNKPNLFYLLSNYVKTVQSPRFNIVTRPEISNMYGASTATGGYPVHHNIEVSVTFDDNYRGDIAKLLHFLSEYKYAVANYGYPMRPEYILNRACDSYISMYVVTCTADMEIVGFGVGLCGTVSDVPTHFTQHNADGFTKEELLGNLSINITFATYLTHAPRYFDYFNNLFNFDPTNIVDLKGSMKTMIAPARMRGTNKVNSKGNGHNTRESLFKMGNFGVKDLNWSSGNSSSATKSQAFAPRDPYSIGVTEFGTVSDSIYNGLLRYTDAASKPNAGIFEHFALSPGVYASVAKSSSVSEELVYKLGFSY